MAREKKYNFTFFQILYHFHPSLCYITVLCLLKKVEIAIKKLSRGVDLLIFLKSESDPEPNQNFSSSEEKLGSEWLRTLSAAVLTASVSIVAMCCHLQPDHINQHPHPAWTVYLL